MACDDRRPWSPLAERKVPVQRGRMRLTLRAGNSLAVAAGRRLSSGISEPRVSLVSRMEARDEAFCCGQNARFWQTPRNESAAERCAIWRPRCESGFDDGGR